MPLSSQGSWGEGSKAPGLTKPRDTTGILPEGPGCLPPALSCSLVNSFYFKPLAGVALTAAAGGGVGMHGDAARAQHHGSTPGGAGKPQQRQLPVHAELRQRVQRKPSQDSLTQRRWPRGSHGSRETSPQNSSGTSPFPPGFPGGALRCARASCTLEKLWVSTPTKHLTTKG